MTFRTLEKRRKRKQPVSTFHKAHNYYFNSVSPISFFSSVWNKILNPLSQCPELFGPCLSLFNFILSLVPAMSQFKKKIKDPFPLPIMQFSLSDRFQTTMLSNSNLFRPRPRVITSNMP